MSEETEGVTEVEAEVDATAEAAVAVDETPEAAADAVEDAPAAEAEVVVETEAVEAQVVDEPAVAAQVVDEPVTAPAVDTGRREAQLYLCERGHRTLILWGDPPVTCNARKTRNEVCGLTLYHSTELPEQVQKALNPIKASKKKSGKK
jgi:hypothetical protein